MFPWDLHPNKHYKRLVDKIEEIALKESENFEITLRFCRKEYQLKNFFEYAEECFSHPSDEDCFGKYIAVEEKTTAVWGFNPQKMRLIKKEASGLSSTELEAKYHPSLMPILKEIPNYSPTLLAFENVRT